MYQTVPFVELNVFVGSFKNFDHSNIWKFARGSWFYYCLKLSSRSQFIYLLNFRSNGKDEKEIAREARRRMKEERLRRKERKMRRKAKLESECLAEKMNCFNHDNQHWRTPPFWTGSLNVFYNSLGIHI